MNKRDKTEEANLILLEFYQNVDDVFLGYFVSLTAPQLWRPHVDKYARERRQLWIDEMGVSPEEAERRVEEADHMFGEGEFRVQTTTAKLRRLLAPGEFENLQAKNAIKLVYDSWDNTYRPQLENLVGSKLQGDIWGDLRYLRQSITHRDSKGVDGISRAKIIKDFAPGQKIVLKHEIMAKIQQEIENWYPEFFQKYGDALAKKEETCQNKQ